jgi:O-antigen ligase
MNAGLLDVNRIPLVTGLADRFVSLLTPDDTMETSSLQWREFENGKALESILKHPLLGVGLGGRYRELTTFQGESLGLWTRGSQAADQITLFTRYVHNSYLSIAVKMGVPALLVLAWFCLAFLVGSWKIYREASTPESRGIVLGILASFAGLLAWSYYHAHLIKAESTPVIGLMTGLIAVVDHLHRHSALPGMSGASYSSNLETHDFHQRG